MQHSSSLDVSEYYKINDKIADTSRFKDINSNILAPLSRLIGAETSIFAILKKHDRGISAQNFICHNIDQKINSKYEKQFQGNDPVLPHAFNAAKSNHSLGISKSFTFALDNIIDFQQFSSGQYYNEFLRPNSIRQVLATGIPSNTDSSLVYILGFHRYCNNSFKEKDAQISSCFGPALYNILNNLELKTQMDDHNIIVSHLKQQISDTGLVILDNNYQIVFANHAGQSHLTLAQNGANSYSDLDNDLMTVLNAYISHMNLSPAKKVEFDHRGIKIVARMITPEIQNQGKRIILNTQRPTHANINSLEIEKYNLTQREVDITSLIVMGMTSPQISAKLCISIRTVENHLRSIYAKTDVKNRTSLAYKLAPTQYQ
ncbi:MAG: hypothetical protein COA93_06775 [Alphaproteobacteria bacterium]|nr:MAG: hypothetical protein COA93_06775 [Alphaproteobacteria bacterium]